MTEVSFKLDWNAEVTVINILDEKGSYVLKKLDFSNGSRKIEMNSGSYEARILIAGQSGHFAKLSVKMGGKTKSKKVVIDKGDFENWGGFGFNV